MPCAVAYQMAGFGVYSATKIYPQK